MFTFSASAQKGREEEDSSVMGVMRDPLAAATAAAATSF